MLKKILLFCLLGIVQAGFGQDSTKTKKIKVLPVPTFGYEPETKAHVGAVALFSLNLYQDSLTRASTAKVEFTYTWRKQAIFEVEWDYFFYQEQWFTKGILHFSKYPDYYYGIGAETPAINELLYESRRGVASFDLFKNIGKSRFLGLGLRYSNYFKLEKEEAVYQELRDREVLGMKTAFLVDRRNRLLNSTSGKFYHVELAYNFSEVNYTRLLADIRHFYTFKDRYTLALRTYHSFTFGRPAFFDHSFLGGDQYVRGYFYGRYRDKNLSTVQAEFRLPVVWRFGLAAFGGISSVYPDLKNFGQVFRPNYGLGLRFLVDKKDQTNLRIDYARGVQGQSGFYISFGEAF